MAHSLLSDSLPTEPTSTAPPGSLRELLHVALPLVVSSGSASLMYVIDRVFLTRYSTEAMAAALPASMLHWTLMSLAIGTVTYVNAFVAQYLRGETVRPDRSRRLARNLLFAGGGGPAAGLYSLVRMDVRSVRPRAGDPPTGNRIFQRALPGNVSAASAVYVVLLLQRPRKDSRHHGHQRGLRRVERRARLFSDLRRRRLASAGHCRRRRSHGDFVDGRR